MNKKRILFISTEMSPYMEITYYAPILNKLASRCFQKGWDVRCIIPYYGVINERRHKLHEVVRLAGIYTQVNNKDYSIQIKVASLPNSHLQVYFIQNEFFGKCKTIFYDENEEWVDSNMDWSIFFAKSALEVVKRLEWAPDIIHCSGWMTSLVPMYLKKQYNREPVFLNSKTIFTIGDVFFNHALPKEYLEIAGVKDALSAKEAQLLSTVDNNALTNIATIFSDGVVLATEHSKIDTKIIQAISKKSKVTKKILKYGGPESDLIEYINFYNDIL
ncbi:MAG: glycogen/starch synthase [Phycisphaerales bacterium]|nr:glycogen/starch synthase [Phycisphaerales bacterium]